MQWHLTPMQWHLTPMQWHLKCTQWHLKCTQWHLKAKRRLKARTPPPLTPTGWHRNAIRKHRNGILTERKTEGSRSKKFSTPEQTGNSPSGISYIPLKKHPNNQPRGKAMENSSENPSVETGENRPIGHMIRAADGTDVPVFDVWIERRRSGEDYAYRTMYYVQTAEGVVPLDAAAYLANVTLDPSRP